jgi:putative toxin-antitoxin system antitoxin component (TIGR02293 family)
MTKKAVIATATGPVKPGSPLVLLGLRDFTVVPTKGHQVIRRGISSQVIEPVSQYLGLGKGALAEFMDLDRGTATRLASKGQDLPSHAAETLLRLLEIHDMASDIFASAEGASTWLRTPHPLLDGERPLDAAKTSYGAQNVKNLLLSTKYGGAA